MHFRSNMGKVTTNAPTILSSRLGSPLIDHVAFDPNSPPIAPSRLATRIPLLSNKCKCHTTRSSSRINKRKKCTSMIFFIFIQLQKYWYIVFIAGAAISPWLPSLNVDGHQICSHANNWAGAHLWHWSHTSNTNNTHSNKMHRVDGAFYGDAWWYRSRSFRWQYTWAQDSSSAAPDNGLAAASTSSRTNHSAPYDDLANWTARRRQHCCCSCCCCWYRLRFASSGKKEKSQKINYTHVCTYSKYLIERVAATVKLSTKSFYSCKNDDIPNTLFYYRLCSWIWIFYTSARESLLVKLNK